MKETLAPTLVEYVNQHVILWFQKSNQYIVTEQSLYSIIKVFFDSKNKEQFQDSLIKLGYDNESAKALFNDVSKFLQDCNLKTKANLAKDEVFTDSNRHITSTYNIDNFLICVHYESEELKQLIHTQIEHLAIRENVSEYATVFDVYTDTNNLFLFRDKIQLGSWPKQDYHLLQGKFTISLLCALHNNEEDDWIGTFHASTVVKNNKACMIIGDSGKGKSTFTAFLLANDFEVLADDLTPILAKDTLVYPYPGGISIKSGAFDILNSSLPNFGSLPQHYINPYKGYVKYISAPKRKGYLTGYPCKIMVSINYQEKAATNLEPIKINEALFTLIPESWLAHDTYNAQQFLSWIKDVIFYKLTYSDSKDAVKVFSQLFKE